jgi:hypothetical protein
VRWTGVSLASGGALVFLLNVGFTPFLLHGVPFEETAASPVFLWRQSASAFAAALLLFGSVGLYLAQAERTGRWGAVAFVAAFLGSALLLAWEWCDVFILYDLAVREPLALRTLEKARGLTLYDWGAIVPLALFTLGWIALAASTMRASPVLRRPALLVVAGFFVIPLLGAAIGLWGAILGNAVMGSGWLLLGRAVVKGAAIDGAA